MPKFLYQTARFLLIATSFSAMAALADPPKKKPNFPPPEESATVGTLGGHHTDPDAPTTRNLPPPPAIAAPEIPKVEAEAPTALPSAPRFEVQPEQGTNTGDNKMNSPLMRYGATMPSGYFAEHPVISGLVAGLIGSDLGARLTGGPMMGDSTALMVGYVVRIGLVLAVLLLLLRMIGSTVSGSTGKVDRGAPLGRLEPGFGKRDDSIDGRREPTFGPPER